MTISMYGLHDYILGVVLGNLNKGVGFRLGRTLTQTRLHMSLLIQIGFSHQNSRSCGSRNRED